MILPTDWTMVRRILVKLLRNIYGLKQAGLLWYILFDKTLRNFGCVRSVWDPCVYIYNDDYMHT